MAAAGLCDLATGGQYDSVMQTQRSATTVCHSNISRVFFAEDKEYVHLSMSVFAVFNYPMFTLSIYLLYNCGNQV